MVDVDTPDAPICLFRMMTGVPTLYQSQTTLEVSFEAGFPRYSDLQIQEIDDNLDR